MVQLYCVKTSRNGKRRWDEHVELWKQTVTNHYSGDKPFSRTFDQLIWRTNQEHFYQASGMFVFTCCLVIFVVTDEGIQLKYWFVTVCFTLVRAHATVSSVITSHLSFFLTGVYKTAAHIYYYLCSTWTSFRTVFNYSILRKVHSSSLGRQWWMERYIYLQRPHSHMHGDNYGWKDTLAHITSFIR